MEVCFQKNVSFEFGKEEAWAYVLKRRKNLVLVPQIWPENKNKRIRMRIVALNRLTNYTIFDVRIPNFVEMLFGRPVTLGKSLFSCHQVLLKIDSLITIFSI